MPAKHNTMIKATALNTQTRIRTRSLAHTNTVQTKLHRVTETSHIWLAITLTLINGF